MTDTTEPATPAADAPVSPYGPAPGMEAAVNAGTANVSMPKPAQRPEWLDRGRRILTVAIWITAGLSVALTVVLITLGILNPGADDLVVGELADTLVWGSIFAAPVLFTIALNLLVWRGLLRWFGGRARSEAFAFILAVSVALAVGSVILVTLLLFFGFLAGAFFGASSGFGA